MIIIYCIIVFLNQLAFTWLRTWNIIVTAEKKIFKVVLSNALIHISWLISISVGVVSIIEIVQNMELQYIPVILFSILGSVVGSYIGIK